MYVLQRQTMGTVQDVERHGRYTGFPILGVEWQKLENPDLRSKLGMPVREHPNLRRMLRKLVQHEKITFVSYPPTSNSQLFHLLLRRLTSKEL